MSADAFLNIISHGVPLRPEFVSAYVDYIFNKSVASLFESFFAGFHKVCGGKVLELFQPNELQAMVIGNTNYDWKELEKVQRSPFISLNDMNWSWSGTVMEFVSFTRALSIKEIIGLNIQPSSSSGRCSTISLWKRRSSFSVSHSLKAFRLSCHNAMLAGAIYCFWH